ncbi:MAG: bifunctional folylpolyglutamate synthase/dihydrofolate synthase, partial [Longimicrobiales bacterium]
MRWGLDRTRRLLAAVGDPHLGYPVVHIGGTNGKGSVAATIAAVQRASGHRVGLYTSPHLCTFRERVRIDGAAIEEDALLASAERLWPRIEAEGPTFFEATTAIAFEAFAAAGVDFAVVEVGLGGRLDATNVVEPEVAIITNVELDHVEFLGETLELIAAEKAGIIKPGRPIVTGERRPELRGLFRRTAVRRGSPYAELDPSSVSDIAVAESGTRLRVATSAWGRLGLETPLLGRHQAMNVALALRGLAALPDASRPGADAVLAGVRDVRWPGRAQIETLAGVRWVFDAAHNPAGVGALLSLLVELHLPRPLVAVVAVLTDKDWERMLMPLSARADRVVLTVAPSSPAGRRWDPAMVAGRLAGKAGATAELIVE